MSHWSPPEGVGLEGLVNLWLADLVGLVDPETVDTYALYWRAHLLPHFGAESAITTARIADYGRRRLRAVKRTTLQKERSTLRVFLTWCVEKGFLEDPPELPELPRRATGTPFAQRRRGAATQLSPEQCRAILEALPQWSTPRHGRPPFVVRPRFVVAYETTLRPATLDALSVPEHYSRGSETLVITDQIDKARFGRELPLTDLAREALDSVAREGVIFGAHDYRDQLQKAARKALPPEKSRTFTAYDLRHARLTELAETGNLTGAAYLAGHRRVTTTAVYVRPGFRAAERVLESVREEPPSGVRPAGLRKALRDTCAKERTRTSTGVTPLAPQPCSGGSSPEDTAYPAEDIAREATALLALAAGSEPVDYARLVAFARSVLEGSELGRLALAVLDGGEHGPRRALELARAVQSDTATAQGLVAVGSKVLPAGQSMHPPEVPDGDQEEAREVGL